MDSGNLKLIPDVAFALSDMEFSATICLHKRVSCATARIMSPNLRDLLANHEAALQERLKKLRDQIIPLERELAEVRRARSAVSLVDHGPEQVEIPFSVAMVSASENHRSFEPPRSPYARLTIKELVCKALDEQFERGATANELLEFFAHAYGRDDIVRTSLSPQLSRLKQEGKIILIGQKWSLPSAGSRTHGDLLRTEKAATSQ